MKDRMHDQGLDMLSMYGLDVFYLLVFVVRETLVELESENHSHLVILKYWWLKELLPIIPKVGSKA
jgi:hypothetical protein